jgi:Na+/H+ antiporter NhaB
MLIEFFQAFPSALFSVAFTILAVAVRFFFFYREMESLRAVEHNPRDKEQQKSDYKRTFADAA